MTSDKFLLEMDEILGLPAGTLRGNEKLEDLGDLGLHCSHQLDCPGGDK